MYGKSLILMKIKNVLKMLSNSPGLWPTSVLDFANVSSGLLVFLTCFLSFFSRSSYQLVLFSRASYQLVLSRAWPLTGPAPPKPWHLAIRMINLAPFWRPVCHFWRFVVVFWSIERTCFWASHRNDKKIKISRPWAAWCPKKGPKS